MEGSMLDSHLRHRLDMVCALPIDDFVVSIDTKP
jgi:hypothetical protein